MSITDSSRDEKRTVREQTISVDCRSDSAADGRARAKKTKGKKKGVGRAMERDKEKKKKNLERKNIFVSVPGFKYPPFLFLSQANNAVNDWVGFAAIPLEASDRRQRSYPLKGGLDWHG